MNQHTGISFSAALDALADIGYTPVRMFKQASLGNASGSVQLLQAVTPDEHVSQYVRFVQIKNAIESGAAQAKSLIENFLADDPAHLVAHQYAESVARDRGDEWGMTLHRTALAELDPGAIREVMQSESKIESKKSVASFSRATFSLTTSEIQLLRQTPMVTETLAALFRDQGHHRMAAAMYKRLLTETYRESLHEKLRTVTRQSIGGVRTSADDLTHT